MLDRTLLLVSPEVYTKHKGTLTPEEIWQVQEALALRYLAAHPEPRVRSWPRGRWVRTGPPAVERQSA